MSSLVCFGCPELSPMKESYISCFQVKNLTRNLSCSYRGKTWDNYYPKTKLMAAPMFALLAVSSTWSSPNCNSSFNSCYYKAHVELIQITDCYELTFSILLSFIGCSSVTVDTELSDRHFPVVIIIFAIYICWSFQQHFHLRDTNRTSFM